jgi:flagellar hook protein FlgE
MSCPLPISSIPTGCAGRETISIRHLRGGAKIEGAPGTGIFRRGRRIPLESSNVDLATEMVTLITEQRAFQSNSKVVTTADEMMKKAMEIKR